MDTLIGGFYAIQPIPEVPWHIKLGWTQNFQRRLSSHRNLCPLAAIVKTWRCQSEQIEREAIDFVEACGFERLGTTEVFLCQKPEQLFSCLDIFFSVIYLQDPRPPRIKPDRQKVRWKGEGTVYKRKTDGRWASQITIGGKRKSFYAKTQKEAFRMMREAKENFELSNELSKVII